MSRRPPETIGSAFLFHLMFNSFYPETFPPEAPPNTYSHTSKSMQYREEMIICPQKTRHFKRTMSAAITKRLPHQHFIYLQLLFFLRDTYYLYSTSNSRRRSEVKQLAYCPLVNKGDSIIQLRSIGFQSSWPSYTLSSSSSIYQLSVQNRAANTSLPSIPEQKQRLSEGLLWDEKDWVIGSPQKYVLEVWGNTWPHHPPALFCLCTERSLRVYAQSEFMQIAQIRAPILKDINTKPKIK